MATSSVDHASFPEFCVSKETGKVHNFAFGSNLSKVKMESRGINVLQSRRAILKDYKLTFTQFGYPPVEPSFANIEYSPNSEVHGILFDMEPSEFSVLFHGEGSGRFHDIEVVEVTCYDGEVVKSCVAFKGNEASRVPGGKELPPSKRYRDLMVTGAKEAGLSQEYQAKLAQIPHVPVPSPLVKMMITGRLNLVNNMAKVLAAYPKGQAPVLIRFADYLFKKENAGWKWASRNLSGTNLGFFMYIYMAPGSMLGVFMETVSCLLSKMRKPSIEASGGSTTGHTLDQCKKAEEGESPAILKVKQMTEEEAAAVTKKLEMAARMKVEQEAAVKKAEEAARIKAEQEAAAKKAEEAARIKAEQEAAALKAEEAARIKAEQEAAAKKAEEAARIKAEQEAAAKKAEEAARIKAEQEAAAAAKKSRGGS